MPPHLRASRQSRRCRKNSQKEQTRLSFKSILFSLVAGRFLVFFIAAFFPRFYEFCCEISCGREQMRHFARQSETIETVSKYSRFFLLFCCRKKVNSKVLHFPSHPWLKSTERENFPVFCCISLWINCGTTFQLEDPYSTKLCPLLLRRNFNFSCCVLSSSHCRLSEHSSAL